jgi:hypothetical protein
MIPEQMEGQIKELTAMVESLSNELTDGKVKISLTPNNGTLEFNLRWGMTIIS